MAMGGFFSRLPPTPHSHTPHPTSPYSLLPQLSAPCWREQTAHITSQHKRAHARTRCISQPAHGEDPWTAGCVCKHAHTRTQRGRKKNIDEASSSHFPRK